MPSTTKSTIESGIKKLPLALNLGIGSDDQINMLNKLQPILLPNHVHGGYETPDLIEARNSHSYIFVVNWLYNFRGFLKLQSEYFDVDIFELELLGHFPESSASGFDELEFASKSSTLFITRLKISLLSAVQNSRLKSIENFEKIFRLWFGNKTPLGGPDEDDDMVPKDASLSKSGSEPEIMFNELQISEKFEILYILIHHICRYASFKNWLEKNALSLDETRANILVSETIQLQPRIEEQFILLCDSLRLYKRRFQYKPITIPKKRKLLPIDPNSDFPPECFDIDVNVQYELLYQNVYELDEFIQSQRRSKGHKELISALSAPLHVDHVLSAEIKKRRYLINRRKELQLSILYATRKRSSRLEAKEKQKQQELETRTIQEEYEMLVAARSERRLRLRSDTTNLHSTPMDFTNGLNRNERLQSRRLQAHSNGPQETSEIFSEIENENLNNKETGQEFGSLTKSRVLIDNDTEQEMIINPISQHETKEEFVPNTLDDSESFLVNARGHKKDHLPNSPTNMTGEGTSNTN